MTDPQQPTDTGGDDVSGHGRWPNVQDEADDVAGHGRNSPIVLDDPDADADDVAGHGRWPNVQDGTGRGRSWLHEQDGPEDVEGHSASFDG